MDQTQEQPDRRRLARSVGPEIAQHLADRHFEVEVAQDVNVPVALGQSLGVDRGDRHGSSL